MAVSEASIVFTTVSDDESASRIARTLVEEGLAACVQRVPIRSTYAWQGRIEESEELLLLVKTTVSSCDAIERRLHELSPYQVPEVITIDAARVSPAYAAWLAAACKGTKGQ